MFSKRKYDFIFLFSFYSSHFSDMHTSQPATQSRQANNKARYEHLVVQITSKMPAWLGHWKLNYDSYAEDVHLLSCPKDFGMEFLNTFLDGYDDADNTSASWIVSPKTPRFPEIFEALKNTHFPVDVDGCLKCEKTLTVEDKDTLIKKTRILNDSALDDGVAQKINSLRDQYETMILNDHQTFCSAVEEELVEAINEILKTVRLVNEQHREMLERVGRVINENESKKRRRSEGDKRLRLNSLKLQNIQVY
jgi:hypothetical protein